MFFQGLVQWNIYVLYGDVEPEKLKEKNKEAIQF